MPDRDLKARTFRFAVSTGQFVSRLPYNSLNREYIRQLIRCSSSVGANYRASQRAKSTSDFIHKLKIVEEETDECIYFLELLSSFNPSYIGEISVLIHEATEILKIIVASLNTARRNMAP
jgi:four helix bundle protein